MLKRLSFLLLYFALNGKLVNLKTFESLNIIKYCPWRARKRETIMIWKKLKITVEQKTFPKKLARKGEKANFRRITIRISIKNGQLCYKESRIVTADMDRQVDIIHDIHEGSGEISYSKSNVSSSWENPNITFHLRNSKCMVLEPLLDWIQKHPQEVFCDKRYS